MNIESIEERFKEVTGLKDIDLSLPHFRKGNDQQQSTTKEEFKKFGYVCSPIWLVDEMLEPEMDKLTLDSRTCDACAGCGQFTIRMMRKFKTRFPDMDVEHWLESSHWFTEFQFSNVAKLVYIFGTNINVYAGNSLNMKYAKDEDRGLLFFNEKQKAWLNIPQLREMVESRKDNLSNLITLFNVIESTWNTINAMGN